MLALRSRLTAPRRPGSSRGSKSKVGYIELRLASPRHYCQNFGIPSSAPFHPPRVYTGFSMNLTKYNYSLKVPLNSQSNHIHWKSSTGQTQQTVTIINPKLAISRAIYKNRTNRIKIISISDWRSHFLCLGMLFCFLMKINHLSRGPHISCWHSLVESQHWYLILIFLFQQTLIIHNVTRPV